MLKTGGHASCAEGPNMICDPLTQKMQRTFLRAVADTGFWSLNKKDMNNNVRIRPKNTALPRLTWLLLECASAGRQRPGRQHKKQKKEPHHVYETNVKTSETFPSPR